MAGKKSDILKVDRLKELEKILDKLRKTYPGESDTDLILKYLEKIINDPKISGGSKKLIGFDIKNDINTMSKIYRLTWRKTAIEEVNENK